MSNTRLFEQRVLPHLDSAYNLARWLVRDTHTAEDVVQESCLRALRYLSSLKNDDGKAWLLGIVRNCSMDVLRGNKRDLESLEFDDDIYEATESTTSFDPAQILASAELREQLDSAIMMLSPPLREVLILREMEDMDYAQIAKIASIPLGTVMSRLSRARIQLRTTLEIHLLGNQHG